MGSAAARTAEIDLLPHQAELLDFGLTNGQPERAFNDWQVALVAAQGQGKTWAGALKAYQLAKLNRGCHGLMVVPTYPVFTLVHKMDLPAILGSIGVRVRWRQQDSCFVWPWGDRLWVRTAEKPEKIIGANVAYLWGDEPANWPDEAIERALGRVRHPKAALRLSVFTGTPEGDTNKFAKMFAAPKAAAKRATIWGRRWHSDMAHYRQILLDLYAHDPSLLDTYGKGRFVPLRKGRVFSPFTIEKHAAHPVDHDANLPLFLTCDFNVHHMRWEVAQITRDEIRFLDEIALGRSQTTGDAAREFVARWSGRHPGRVIVTGDATGKNATTKATASTTDYQVIEEIVSGHFHSVSIEVPNHNPPIRESVDACNYHLGGGLHGMRVRIAPVCVELVADLQGNAWKKGSSTEIDESDPERKHASDTFRYLVWQYAQPEAQKIILSRGRVRGAGNPAYERW